MRGMRAIKIPSHETEPLFCETASFGRDGAGGGRDEFAFVERRSRARHYGGRQQVRAARGPPPLRRPGAPLARGHLPLRVPPHGPRRRPRHHPLHAHLLPGQIGRRRRQREGPEGGNQSAAAQNSQGQFAGGHPGVRNRRFDLRFQVVVWPIPLVVCGSRSWICGWSFVYPDARYFRSSHIRLLLLCCCGGIWSSEGDLAAEEDAGAGNGAFQRFERGLGAAAAPEQTDLPAVVFLPGKVSSAVREGAFGGLRGPRGARRRPARDFRRHSGRPARRRSSGPRPAKPEARRRRRPIGGRLRLELPGLPGRLRGPAALDAVPGGAEQGPRRWNGRGRFRGRRRPLVPAAPLSLHFGGRPRLHRPAGGAGQGVRPVVAALGVRPVHRVDAARKTQRAGPHLPSVCQNYFHRVYQGQSRQNHRRLQKHSATEQVVLKAELH